MNPLARLDLSRFQIDDESFVGQAIALGVRFEKLPPQISDALLGYLRAKGLTYGQRNRTGIAMSREGLERGVRQALICLDIGLRDQAQGDLNVAVDILAQGDFESIRKNGYERAFFQLHEIRKGSLALLTRTTATFLQTEHRNLKRWSSLVPETWTRPADDLEDEEQLVDPRSDYGLFQETEARMDFLNSIPNDALRNLEQLVTDGRSFDGLLRNLMLALSLDLESLLPSQEHIAHFENTCFDEQRLKPEIRDKVLHLMDRQLEASVDDGTWREAIRDAFLDEITFVEDSLVGGLQGVFLLPGKKPVTADDLLGETALE